MAKLDNYLEIAIEAARIAGDLLMEDFGSVVELNFGAEKHCSISQDQKSDRVYRNFLQKKTPDIPLYSEEYRDKIDGEFVWVIDSLDGTTNYSMGLPLFITQICLLQNREAIVSVLYNPALKQEYTARKGQGAFLNGKRIFTNNISDIGKSLLVQGKGRANINKTAWYMALLGNHVRTVRIFGGCTGIDLALLASGRCEIVLNLNSKPYDYAPGVLLAREAGAKVLNLKGEEWTIVDDNMVAAGPNLLPKVMRIIRQASNN